MVLHHATILGHVEMVELLLRHGADINGVTKVCVDVQRLRSFGCITHCWHGNAW